MEKKAKIIIAILAVAVVGLAAALIGVKVHERQFKLYKNIICYEIL